MNRTDGDNGSTDVPRREFVLGYAAPEPAAHSVRGWLIDIGVGLAIRFVILPSAAFLFPISDPPSYRRTADLLWQINTFEVKWAVRTVPARPWVFIVGIAGMLATAVIYGVIPMTAIRFCRTRWRVWRRGNGHW